jgi:cold shock CspA family protein
VSLPKDPEFDESARLNAHPPAEPIGTQHTAIGIVKWWKENKGYGAIACSDTRPWDIWFHYSALTATGVATLPSGEKVEAISDGHSGLWNLATGERLGACDFAATEPRTVQVGARVEVGFHRADQESFKYVADRVHLVTQDNASRASDTR